MKTKLKEIKKKDVWFAWYPVKLDDNHICWLEYVKRTPIYGYYGTVFMYYVYQSMDSIK